MIAIHSIEKMLPLTNRLASATTSKTMRSRPRSRWRFRKEARPSPWNHKHRSSKIRRISTTLESRSLEIMTTSSSCWSSIAKEYLWMSLRWEKVNKETIMAVMLFSQIPMLYHPERASAYHKLNWWKTNTAKVSIKCKRVNLILRIRLLNPDRNWDCQLDIRISLMMSMTEMVIWKKLQMETIPREWPVSGFSAHTKNRPPRIRKSSSPGSPYQSP